MTDPSLLVPDPDLFLAETQTGLAELRDLLGWGKAGNSAQLSQSHSLPVYSK